jgi:hypothetical protein
MFMMAVIFESLAVISVSDFFLRRAAELRKLSRTLIRACESPSSSWL